MDWVFVPPQSHVGALIPNVIEFIGVATERQLGLDEVRGGVPMTGLMSL